MRGGWTPIPAVAVPVAASWLRLDNHLAREMGRIPVKTGIRRALVVAER